MNTAKAQTIINQIVTDFRAAAYKGGRKQYPASKKYLAQAEKIGILELIPNAPASRYIGNTEIQLILKAATDSGTAVFGAEDGETINAHQLYLAIHEVQEPVQDTTYNPYDVTTYARAPRGGVTISGKFYRGGQFIPQAARDAAVQRASKRVERAERMIANRAKFLPTRTF